jgi:hypothetical protein
VWELASFSLLLWLPAIFVAYAIGRRRVSVALVVILALAELALGLFIWFVVVKVPGEPF